MLQNAAASVFKIFSPSKLYKNKGTILPFSSQEVDAHSGAFLISSFVTADDHDSHDQAMGSENKENATPSVAAKSPGQMFSPIKSSEHGNSFENVFSPLPISKPAAPSK